MITEEQLQKWGSAPSKTEMAKIKATKDLIERKLKDFLPIDEIKTENNLSNFDYEVYLQGSYKIVLIFVLIVTLILLYN